ncbi:MAG: family 3 adenylate cyclase [Candidatus Riflebacteria bacterium]|nr:family 3 adenylate cyclase [Candidatus Riflebacteria bacterium]
MKRITYISQLAPEVRREALAGIARVAAGHNAAVGITGVLVAVGGFFFQVIEGPADRIDALMTRIRADRRHRELRILACEEGVAARLFPDWAMRPVDLDAASDDVLRPIRVLLERLAHSHAVIQRYTQPAVMRILERGLDPLSVPLRRRERVILFADLVGFSRLVERFPDEAIAGMVTRFIDICDGRVAAAGGEVSKVIGDCVMAFAPREQTDAMIAAALGILGDLHRCRTEAVDGRAEACLRCGIGLSLGAVLEGNLGSQRKSDYTVLGDAVNVASRLEAISRTTGRALILSAPVRAAARQSWPFVALGCHPLKGKSEPQELFTLNDPLIDDPELLHHRV